MNGKQTYKLPEREIQRYSQHGMAFVHISRMSAFPIGGFSIDVEPLVKIRTPTHAWVVRTPDAPKAIISSGKQKDIPKSAVAISSGKNLVAIEVTGLPKPDFSDLQMEPIYG